MNFHRRLNTIATIILACTGAPLLIVGLVIGEPFLALGAVGFLVVAAILFPNTKLRPNKHGS